VGEAVAGCPARARHQGCHPNQWRPTWGSVSSLSTAAATGTPPVQRHCQSWGGGLPARQAQQQQQYLQQRSNLARVSAPTLLATLASDAAARSARRHTHHRAVGYAMFAGPDLFAPGAGPAAAAAMHTGRRLSSSSAGAVPLVVADRSSSDFTTSRYRTVRLLLMGRTLLDYLAEQQRRGQLATASIDVGALPHAASETAGSGEGLFPGVPGFAGGAASAAVPAEEAAAIGGFSGWQGLAGMPGLGVGGTSSWRCCCWWVLFCAAPRGALLPPIDTAQSQNPFAS